MACSVDYHCAMPNVLIDGEGEFVDMLPRQCPRCHNYISPVSRPGGVAVEAMTDFVASVPFQCPACKWLFLATYRHNEHQTLKLVSVTPHEPIKKSFGLIDTLSPQFVLIFNQAAAAESFGLNEVCGLAYRKSLEFLLKDFCISETPGEAEAIKAMKLGEVIKMRLKDVNVQLAAEKATWLGNDEAHYVRKWENHDVQDLKSLLRIAVSGITGALELAAHIKTFQAPTANAIP